MKIKLLLFITFTAFLSCSGPSPKQEDSATQQSVADQVKDQELLKMAQGIFQPLPAIAENKDNAITPEKTSLGKILYYDTRLSKTGNNSCNSCHNLATFGVDNKTTSLGDAGKNGTRNSPTVLNAALHTTQFWDGRAKDVEEQAGGPILNPVEMAMASKDAVTKRLAAVKEYQDLFKAAFPDQKNPITYDNLQKAIGAFERTLITPSKFDKFLGGDLTALNTEEKTGLKDFMDAGCMACHSGTVLGGQMFQKFGVTMDYHSLTGSDTKDEGRKAITKNESDKDFFKVPSLRNIEKTGPYFHDGSIADLGKAVSIMAKVQTNKDLTEKQVKSIVSFLNSLTGVVPADAQVIPKELASK